MRTEDLEPRQLTISEVPQRHKEHFAIICSPCQVENGSTFCFQYSLLSRRLNESVVRCFSMPENKLPDRNGLHRSVPIHRHTELSPSLSGFPFNEVWIQISRRQSLWWAPSLNIERVKIDIVRRWEFKQELYCVSNFIFSVACGLSMMTS